MTETAKDQRQRVGKTLAPDAAIHADVRVPGQLSPAELQSAELLGQTDGVRAAADRGLQGAGGQLPYFAQIQPAFGHHDISGLRAHTGGAGQEAAAQIGAQAYATGNDVVFAGSPSLHTAAHEAAHVIQQRGGARVSGGVGRVGDKHEKHADAVADLVVKGESAEALLDSYITAGASPTHAIQRQAAPTVTPTAMVAAPAPAWKVDAHGVSAAGTTAKLYSDALAEQLAAENEVITRILTAAPAPLPALDATFLPAFVAVHAAAQKAEAMEVLSRLTLRMRTVELPASKGPETYAEKQILLNQLPGSLAADSVAVSSVDADQLTQLFALSGGDYQVAIGARVGAVEDLRTLYLDQAVPREQAQHYLRYSSDDDRTKTATISGPHDRGGRRAAVGQA